MRFTRILGLVLAVAVLFQSCYGPFNATRSLHKWNGEVTENEWGQEGMFLLLHIIPAYPLWVLGDSLIFNSIEFWGGENPIDPPSDG